MEGKPNRRNKAAFSNFPAVVCMGPEKLKKIKVNGGS